MGKCEGPPQVITFLGLEIHSIEMQVRLPEKKVWEIRTTILDMFRKSKTNLKTIQSLVNFLGGLTRLLDASILAITRVFFF